MPLWALDADAVHGALWLRLARGGERLAGESEAPSLPDGQIVVADSRAPLAPLFGDPAPTVCAGRGTARLLLFAVRVAGVEQAHVHEALWQCAEVLDGA